MVIKRKVASCGLVELRQEHGEYVLYVDGKVKSYSKDLDFMIREFDRTY